MTQPSFVQVELAHPGFRVIAGPFQHNHPAKTVQTAERAACFRSVKDQQAKGVKAFIKQFGGFAWVLRSTQGWKVNTHLNQPQYKDASGEALDEEASIPPILCLILFVRAERVTSLI